MKRKAIYLLLLSMLIVSLFAIYGCSRQDKEVIMGDYELMRNYDDSNYLDSYYISHYSGTDENVTLPTTAPDGLPITVVGKWAFTGNTHIKSVTIPDSYESIGANAFYNCSALESVHIGSGVSDISSYEVFAVCNQLNTIIVSKQNSVYYSVDNCIVSSTDQMLVLGCKTSVIPEGIKKIGTCAFSNIDALESIQIPDSVTEIGEWAFYSCSGLKEIWLGTNIDVVGEFAFMDCADLTVYCEDDAKPVGWSDLWNKASDTAENQYPIPTVVWGATKQ